MLFYEIIFMQIKITCKSYYSFATVLKALKWRIA
jgi:hypothetical protein